MKFSELLDPLALVLKKKEIYRYEDDQGPVVVLEYSGLRVLTFDSFAEQSVLCLEKPHTLVHEYTKTMLVVLLFKQPKHVTLLGLGGGSLLRCLHHHYPDVDFQVVELRQSVIDIATQFFQIPNDARVSILQENARNFLRKKPATPTDIIFADMYHAYAVDSFQKQLAFLQQCNNILAEDGWLVLNFTMNLPLQDPIVLQMNSIFPVVYLCGTDSGNWVVFCGKRDIDLDYPSLRPEALRFEATTGEEVLTSIERMIRVG